MYAIRRGRPRRPPGDDRKSASAAVSNAISMPGLYCPWASENAFFPPHEFKSSDEQILKSPLRLM